MMTLGHLAFKIFALGIPSFESLHCSKFNFFAIEDFLSVAKCDLYRQPIRCPSPCDSSTECSYFVGLSLPPPLYPPPLHHHADCVTEKTVRCLSVNHCMDVSITTGKCRGPRGCETLWPPPHVPPLKNSCCDLASSLFCELKPIAESWKNTCRQAPDVEDRLR